MKTRFLLLFLLFNYLNNEIAAQGVRLFTSADGLPSSQFIFMSQDKEGYIWICNYGGLTRFDGNGLTAYYDSREKERLQGNSIYRFLTDRYGQSWIGTERGLQLFHYQTDRFEYIRLDKDQNDSSIDKSISVFDIALLPGGERLLVCAGGNGFYVIDLQSRKVIEDETRKFRSVLKNISAGRIYIDSKQRLWIVGNQELIALDLQSFHFLKINYTKHTGLQPQNMEITDFIEDSRTHTLLVADKWNGVLLFDEQDRQFQILDKKTVYRNAQCLLQRKDGTLLVGCECNGIGKIDIQKRIISEYNLRDCPINLKYSKIHEMIEDRWKNLYVGIYQKGLLVVPASTGGFSYQAIGISQPTQNRAAVTSFVAAGTGEIFIGTDGGGVLSGKNADHLKELLLPAECNNSIQDMVADNNNKIWLATYGSGLFCYSKNSAKLIKDSKNVINKNVSCLQLDQVHNKLFIGNIGTGINQLDLANGQLSKVPVDIPYVFALKSDSKGRLWIGGANCLCYDPINEEEYHFSLTKIKNSTVNTFFEDKDLMYIGTKNGLFIYDEQSDSCRHYLLSNDKKSVSVLAIAKSRTGSIWLSTSHGLTRFNPKDEDIRNFYSYDIQKVGDFHKNAIFTQRNGTLIFGGDNGIVSFNPLSIEKRKEDPVPIHFNSLYINGEKVSYNANTQKNELDAAIGYASCITLPYNQNSFTIGFSAFNYAVSSRLRYLYKLEDFETKWHTTVTDHPQAVYNQLPPGQYKLRVKCLNEEKETACSEITMKVTVQSAWYWAWWSKLLYGLILIAIIYTQYRAYQMRKRSKKRLRTVMSEFLRIKEDYYNLTKNQEVVCKTNPLDEELKNKILSSITMHYSNIGFGVEELSKDVALSRVHLYRRTKQLFDCSPNDLLKSIRMKKAGLMLIQSKASISDVAYKTGFSEASYFSKAFKNYFNMTPKDFIARYRDHADEDTIRQLFGLETD